MLIAKIDGAGIEEVDDGIFPTAIIGFYDAATDFRDAGCTYILRAGSAYETMEDVATDVAVRLAVYNETQPTSLPVVPALDAVGLATEAIIESAIGQEVSDAFATPA